MPREKTPEINAGSMADIAFLLLVFFLVTTTIATDSGVNTILPPYIPPTTEPPPIERQNLYQIKINSQNQLLLNGETPGRYQEIKPILIEFLTNYGKRPDYSENPKVAVVSIQNDNGSSFETYLTVYNEVKAAYNAIWEAAAQKQFGRNMDKLVAWEVDSIKAQYPQLISEAEPTNFGN